MIYLGGPLVWDAAGTPAPSYRAPAGMIAVVDLRTIPQQSVANHANGPGNGFFAAPDGTPIPEGYEVLATGDLRESAIGQPVRSAWQSIYGVTIPGDADHLIDCLSLTLGDMSDPTGDAGPKPLVPGVAPVGECCIHLAGHSIVYRRKLTVQTGGSQHARRLRDLLRRDLEAIADNDPDPDLWRRVLGYQKRKYGQAWDDDFEDWILTAKLKGKGKGKNGRTVADEPRTSYTESLPTDGELNSGQNRSWTYIEGGTGDTAVSGGKWVMSNTSSSRARMDSALSGTDQTASCNFAANPSSTGGVGSICRKDSSSTLTHYMQLHQYYSGGGTDRGKSYKCVTGTYTLLQETAAYTLALNDATELQVNGSSIIRKYNGATANTSTDTSIAGNTYCGWYITGSGANTAQSNTWACADLGGGASRPDLGLLLGVS